MSLTSGKSKHIVPRGIVRRLLSISVVVALMGSLLPGRTAMKCHEMGLSKMCHRTAGAVHHCEMMQDEQPVRDSNSDKNIGALDSPSKCPMNCCFQFGSRIVAAVHVVWSYSQNLAMQGAFQIPAVVFVSSGFSSHTDRGPPA